MIKIELRNKDNQLIQGEIDHEKVTQPYQVVGKDLAVLAIKDYLYQPGDKLVITSKQANQYLMVQLDETLVPSLIYLTGTQWEYQLPHKQMEKKAAIETSFSSKRHHIMVREAYPFEIMQYQNLSINSHDQKESTGAYPHATANVETRDEAIFYAKNAIDGKYGNYSHGSYPFTSWGINQQKDAELTIEFGREVRVDWVRLLFRGDYPHDSYWTNVTIEFSDGNNLCVPTIKSLEFQNVKFPLKKTTSLTLKNLRKVSDESPFPALTQIEVFGLNQI